MTADKDPYGGATGGLREAMRLQRLAAKRRPTDEDRPPPSTFPMTPAARAAKELRKQAEK